MKIHLLRKLLLFAFAALFLGLSAQDQKKPASPPDSSSGKIGNTLISIRYSSPSVKGRKIWGGLVPYDKVWRAGANEATVFRADKDVMIEGQKLSAGRYALFVLPTENEWTIIFNKKADQWGAFKYDATQDALRVSVKPKKSESFKETLKYHINPQGFTLEWENLIVPVSVKPQ